MADIDAIRQRSDEALKLARAWDDKRDENRVLGSVPGIVDGLAVSARDIPALLARVRELTEERVEARTLIGDLYDESECWYDHHGYCQAHGWTDTTLCPHRRAAIVLGLRGSDV